MSSIPGLSDSLLTSLSQVRKESVKISYQGVDVSATFLPSLVDFTYKESFSDHQLTDTLELVLADPEGLLRKSWYLTTGQTVSASIIVENWSGAGSGTLTKPLGLMYIKTVRMGQSKGAGTSFLLSCSSLNPATAFRLEKKSRAWTNSTVKDVVHQIATDSQLTPNYTPATNPAMERLDQFDHSDAVALHRACDPHDFLPKVINNTLWIRDQHEVEMSSPVGTIVCPSTGNVGGINGSGIIRWEFSEATEDCNYT
jgi:phage protein D